MKTKYVAIVRQGETKELKWETNLRKLRQFVSKYAYDHKGVPVTIEKYLGQSRYEEIVTLTHNN